MRSQLKCYDYTGKVNFHQQVIHQGFWLIDASFSLAFKDKIITNKNFLALLTIFEL